MIKEEIVLLKSSLSKMSSYENEIFIKINERLKNIEESKDLSSYAVSSKSEENVVSNLDNQLTEENINLLNQEFERSSMVDNDNDNDNDEDKDKDNDNDNDNEHTDELEKMLLTSEELNELNSINVEEINDNDEMRQIDDNINQSGFK